MQGLYILTNTVNGKQYVGKDVQLPSRPKIHLSGKAPNCRAIHNAIKKHGADAFDVEIIPLPDLTAQDLYDAEQAKIVELDTKAPNGYNLTDGGPGLSGHDFSDEHRRKLSELNSGENNPNFGRVYTPEERKEIAERSTGWKQTDKSRQSISDNHARYWKGKDFSEEHRVNISKALKGKPKSALTRQRMKEAQQKRGREMSDEIRQQLSERAKQQRAREKYGRDKARGQLFLFRKE